MWLLLWRKITLMYCWFPCPCQLQQPSLALSIFKSILEQKGVKTQVRHLPWIMRNGPTGGSTIRSAPGTAGPWRLARPSIFPSQTDWRNMWRDPMGGCWEHDRPFCKEPVVGLPGTDPGAAEETPPFWTGVSRLSPPCSPGAALTPGSTNRASPWPRPSGFCPTSLLSWEGPTAGVMGLKHPQFPFLDAGSGRRGRVFPSW